MYDIIIIGAGPAGLTAAIYAERAEKETLVLEANSYGGQIITTDKIENYPGMPGVSGYDFATALYKQAKDLGAEIKFEKAIEIKDNPKYKEVITEKGSYKAKAVIIATGADNRKLGLKNEDKLVGKGVSYCATCDGAFYKKKIVAVNGGGNTALSEALYLSDLAKTVYLIYRRDEFTKASKTLVRKVEKKENIKIMFNTIITKLNVKDGVLNSIDIETKDEEPSNLEINGLFVAVGHVPENENFAKLIKTDSAGYIISSEDCLTNVDGIFVAGDNRVKEIRQLTTATADGTVAASAAIKYINDMEEKNV